MELIQSPLTFRLTSLEDAPHLSKWLNAPEICNWFPMCDAREIEDSVRIWVSYSRIEAGITAEWNSEPCGMANLYIQPYKKLKHTCLFSIIVKEGMRGKGVGQAMMAQLMQRAKKYFNIEILHLEVYEDNPAKRLYERLGFKEFGYQPRFIKEDGKYRGKTFMQINL